MCDKTKDLDVNEVFENLLFAEEIAHSSGYQEGYATGKNHLLDGYHLGYHRASLLGAQLGYYSGILEQYLNINQSVSSKAVVLAKEILQDITKFPKHNDENVEILKAADNIKFKYAKFCSLAKINSLYPKPENLDF